MIQLERAANMAIIVACGLVIASLGRNFYISRRQAADSLPAMKRGQVLTVPGYAPDNRQPTLVMALSTHCSFCQASVPFYQKLTAFKKSAPQGLRLLAVLPEDQDAAIAYLKEHGIAADAVLSLPLSGIGVNGTPTLMLLDERNKLEEFWVGKLTDGQEATVLARLKQACTNCPSHGELVLPLMSNDELVQIGQ